MRPKTSSRTPFALFHSKSNPEGPRQESVSSEQRRITRADVKTLTLVSCLLVLIGVAIALGIGIRHHAPSPPSPAATTTLPSTTTSLPPPGPDVVPDVLGLTALEAVEDLLAAGLTNSIHNLNCPGSFGSGHVVAQNPPAGFRAASDSRVNLQISCQGLGASTTTSIPG